MDSRSGEKITEDTPEEFIQYHIEKSHDVSIRSAPWSRYPIRSHTGQLPMYGMEAVMGTKQLQKRQSN